jgi:hypothetical protein
MPRRKRGEWNKPIHGNLLASLMDGVRTLDRSTDFALFFEQTVSDLCTSQKQRDQPELFGGNRFDLIGDVVIRHFAVGNLQSDGYKD